MLWVGLTGGIGTGKSSVTRILRHKLIPVVDADELAREVVRPGTDGHSEVVKSFGPEAVHQNGELDRKKIGEQVFKDKTKLALLEHIIHPRVRKLALQKKSELQQQGQAIAFYDVPLLFEKKMEDLFDQVVVVSCDLHVQKNRLMKRDGFSEEEALRRIQAQLPLEEKVKVAHFTILNHGSLADLEVEVERVLLKLLALK